MRASRLLVLVLVLAASAARAGDDARSAVNEGLIAFRSGDTDHAIRLLTDAIKSHELGETTLATVYFDRGGMYLAKSEYDAAIADADKAVKLWPGYGDALKLRGTAKFAKNDSDGAIADFRAASAALPHDEGVHVDLGNALRVKGQFDEALKEFSAAIAMKPGALAYAGRAVVYISMGKSEAAVGDLNEAIRLQPDFVTAYVDRAGAYSALGRFDLAAADFDTVLKYRPGDANAIAGRAIDDYTAALELAPNDARIYNNRGNAFAAMSKFDQAIADYDAALRIQPGYAEALHNREGAMKAKTTGKKVQG